MLDRSVTSFVAYISILLSHFCSFDFLTFFLFLFCRLRQNHTHQRTSRPYAYHQWFHYAEWAEDDQKAEAKSELRSSGGPVLCELDASGNPTSERFFGCGPHFHVSGLFLLLLSSIRRFYGCPPKTTRSGNASTRYAASYYVSLLALALVSFPDSLRNIMYR